MMHQRDGLKFVYTCECMLRKGLYLLIMSLTQHTEVVEHVRATMDSFSPTSYLRAR